MIILACIVHFGHLNIRSRLISQPNNKLISNNDQLFNATNLSPISFGIIFFPNPQGINSTNSQINPGTMNEHKNSKVGIIKVLLDSCAIALILRRDVFHEHQSIHKDNKNK